MAIPPFDLDNEDSTREDDEAEDLFERAREQWPEAKNWAWFVNTKDVSELEREGLRAPVFYSAEDALAYMLRTPPLVIISKIIYNAVEDTYGIYVDYDGSPYGGGVSA